MSKNLLNELMSGASQMSLPLTHDTAEQLVSLLELLHKWNQAYNLTAIRSFEQMLTHHLLDSLAVAPYITGARVLDVGTGAGFPGLPLAFYFPEKYFVLLDSNGKKIRFIDQVKRDFALANVEPHQDRVENFRSEQLFDVIICRALGEMRDVIKASRHLLAPTGRWVFMKGTYPQAELAAIPMAADVHALQVPGVEAQRHVVIVPIT